MDISGEEFDFYVCKAIESIDPEFRSYLDEVPVIVEDLPDEQVAKVMNLPHRQVLLGLFRGVPLNRQSASAPAGPNQIILYRRNILAHCQNDRQLARQIRNTIVHELGHHLGFSEQQLRRYQK